MLPRHRAFRLHCRPSVAPMSLPRQAGAFIYDHLGRVEQTYVAKGRLFLFIKFMASPRLHTVKTGRIGPKVSCRMTASDVRTSVNSVGAVKEDKVDDSSKACCPVTRCGQSASRKGVRGHGWKGRGSGSAGGRATWHQDPGPSWLWTLLGQLQVAEWERKNPQGSGHRTRQLERVLGLWLSTCRLQRGERNRDSLLLGGSELGMTFQEGNLAGGYGSTRKVCPYDPVILCPRISPKEADTLEKPSGIFFFFSELLITVKNWKPGPTKRS